MMVEDLGVEAKESAVREVAKLLSLPELLQSIATIKADYIARQQVKFCCISLLLPSLIQLENPFGQLFIGSFSINVGLIVDLGFWSRDCDSCTIDFFLGADIILFIGNC